MRRIRVSPGAAKFRFALRLRNSFLRAGMPLDDLIRRNPPGAHPRNLRAAVIEAVELVREQWSVEVVGYDQAGNNAERSDNASNLMLLFIPSCLSSPSAAASCACRASRALRTL